jgi:hypothetical protein
LVSNKAISSLSSYKGTAGPTSALAVAVANVVTVSKSEKLSVRNFMPTRYSTKKPNSNARANRVLFCIGTLLSDFSKGGKFFPLSRRSGFQPHPIAKKKASVKRWLHGLSSRKH